LDNIKGGESVKKSRPFAFILGVGIIAAVLSLLIFRGDFRESFDYNVKITKWDNIYEGSNIQFYYMTKDNVKLVDLKNKYSLDKVVSEASNDLEKALAMVQWLNRRAEVKPTAMESKKTVDEMITALEINKVISLKEYNAILEEALSSIGVICRTGEFRASNNTKLKDEINYCTLEVWSRAHGKWVMVDGRVEGYLTKADIPLSAIDIINVNHKEITSENIKEPKKYLKYLSNYLSTYTTKVDNNKYNEPKSNSYITFVKNEEDIQLETLIGYLQPTIFVKEEKLFNINPEVVYHNDESDKKPTIILAKRNTKDDNEEYVKFTIGTFIHSYMIDNYYISINGKEYTPVETYYDLSLPLGITTISLSLDGKTKIRSIELQR
jgi:hypothetical protein